MWLLLVVAVLLLGFVFTFTQLWPAPHGRIVAEYTADGVDEEASYVPGHGEAGGPPLKLGPPKLWSGQTFQFECEVILPDGAVWLRLADALYWYSREELHPPRGTHPPALPSC